MKIITWKPKKRAALLAAVLALCMAGYVAAWPSLAGAYATDRPLPIYCVDTKQKTCSISFDAAWGNEDTQTLIDILEKYQVKATFFVVGDWVDKYPESVKALSDAGHEVMSHSNHHDHYNSLTAEQITADLKASCDKVEAVTGVRPTLIRCPYGEYDDHVIRTIRACGMEPIQWDVDVSETAASPCGAMNRGEFPKWLNDARTGTASDEHGTPGPVWDRGCCHLSTCFGPGKTYQSPDRNRAAGSPAAPLAPDVQDASAGE